MFCDEPTGSLDSKNGVRVLGAIADVSAQVGATTMIVTHNAVVADIADRIIEFSDGAVAQLRVNTAKRSPAELAW